MNELDLLPGDLRMALAVLGVLPLIAGIDGVYKCSIVFAGEGGDILTAGYGESCEPAIIAIEPASAP